MPLLARFSFSDGRAALSCEGDSYKELLRHLYYQLQDSRNAVGSSTVTNRSLREPEQSTVPAPRLGDVRIQADVSFGDGGEEPFSESAGSIRALMRKVWSRLHVVNPSVLCGLGSRRELQRIRGETQVSPSELRRRETRCRHRGGEEDTEKEERDRSRSRSPHPNLREEEEEDEGDSADDLEWMLEPSRAADFYGRSSSDASENDYSSDDSLSERDHEEEPLVLEDSESESTSLTRRNPDV